MLSFLLGQSAGGRQGPRRRQVGPPALQLMQGVTALLPQPGSLMKPAVFVRAFPSGGLRGEPGADDEGDHEHEENPREGARKTTEHQPQDHAADQSTSGTFTAEVKCLVGLGLGIATTLSCRPASHKLSGD